MKGKSINRGSFLASKNFQRYMKDVSKHKVLTGDQETLLLAEIENGSQAAIDKLVSANLKFVVTIARQYANQGLPTEDLISEGNYGLLKAVKDFDASRGFKFISYAVWWVRESILTALAEHSRTVRIPLNKVYDISKINKAYSKLEQQLERIPSAVELADLLGVNLRKVEDAIRSNGRTMSMDTPLSDESDNTLKDLLTHNPLRTDSSMIEEGMLNEIGRALGKLSEKEAEVVKYSFGLEGYPTLTLNMLSDKMGVTAERVRQIRINGLKKLSTQADKHVLKTFL